MARGDWLSVPGTYGAYQHHGIDLGDGRVCHYTSDLGQFAAQTLNLPGQGGSKQPVQAEIQIQTMAEFTDHGRRPVTVVRHCMSHDDGDHIVYRALSSLGERKYDLLFNNCEHFASWAFTGAERKSEQVCARGCTCMYECMNV